MQNIQDEIRQLLKDALIELQLEIPQHIHLEHPADSEHGEWSSNVALLGFKSQVLGFSHEEKRKIRKQEELGIENQGSRIKANKITRDSRFKIQDSRFKNPRELAQAIVDVISQNIHNSQFLSAQAGTIRNIQVAGPGFINFYLSNEFYMSEMGKTIESRGNIATKTNMGKKAIVEFSSPNIAKPFTIGHLRSTIIGAAVANLLEETGYTVLRDNHLGDWGTQFGKLIVAIQKWGNIEEISKSKHPVKELVALYVKFHEVAEQHPELEDDAREWFKKLEDGSQVARDLWQRCIDWSWQEFDKIYQELGVQFASEFDQGRGLGESFFEDKMQVVIGEMHKTGFLKRGEAGAELFFFPKEKYPPLMILKKDGSTLYATRDLATDYYRKSQYSPDLIVNEVGGEQTLYFRQIFEIEKLLGWYQEGQRVHVKHGLYRFKDKKMSTRKGNVIWLEEVLTEAKKRATEMSRLKSKVNRQPSDVIGIGALKWNDLRRKSELDIVFDWDEILNMEGNSGPYLQYTYARAKSVLRKGKWENGKTGKQERANKFNQDELAVLRQLSRFGETVESAAREFAPHILCTYLFDLAQAFNSFYAKHSILGVRDKGLEVSGSGEFRLQLTESVAIVIQKGLNILGIETVEEM